MRPQGSVAQLAEATDLSSVQCGSSPTAPTSDHSHAQAQENHCASHQESVITKPNLTVGQRNHDWPRSVNAEPKHGTVIIQYKTNKRGVDHPYVEVQWMVVDVSIFMQRTVLV